MRSTYNLELENIFLEFLKHFIINIICIEMSILSRKVLVWPDFLFVGTGKYLIVV